MRRSGEEEFIIYFGRKYNITVDFKESVGEEVKCILLVQDRENFLFHKVRRTF